MEFLELAAAVLEPCHEERNPEAAFRLSCHLQAKQWSFEWNITVFFKTSHHPVSALPSCIQLRCLHGERVHTTSQRRTFQASVVTEVLGGLLMQGSRVLSVKSRALQVPGYPGSGDVHLLRRPSPKSIGKQWIKSIRVNSLNWVWCGR